jgi:hypothetical protein
MQSELLLLADTCVKKNSAAWLDEVVLATIGATIYANSWCE